MAVPPTTNPGSMLTPPGQPQPLQPGEFTPSAPPNVVTFSTQKVTPPSPLYIQRDDVIGIQLTSSQSTETVIVSGRFMRVADGQIGFFTQTYAVSAAYTVTTFTLNLGEGWLLGVNAQAQGATERGVTFVRLAIARLPFPAIGVQNQAQMLVADYVTNGGAIGWPGGRQVAPTEGPGVFRLLTNSPGVGADISIALGNNFARWRPMCMSAKLVASAAVANRNVHFAFINAVSGASWSGAPASQTAGTTVTYNWAPSLFNYTDADGVVVVPMPTGLLCPKNSTIISKTTNLQAGDQWTVIALIVEEWLDW